MIKNKTNVQDDSGKPVVNSSSENMKDIDNQDIDNITSTISTDDTVAMKTSLAPKNLTRSADPESLSGPNAATPNRNAEPRVEYWDLTQAIIEIKKQAKANFVESVDVVFKLGIDPKQSTQQMRGFTLLDHDYPRNIRVAVLVESDSEVKAVTKAGADRVGYDDLIEEIKADKMNFDVLVTTPGNVFLVAKFGKILGTKGLMPNPKLGTVTTDLVQAVLNIKNRQVNFRSDRYGLIHASIGKTNFTDQVLVDNVNNLAQTLTRNRPTEAKGVFLRKLWCCSTMGKSLQVNVASLVLN